MKYKSAILESKKFETDDMPFYTWSMYGVTESGKEEQVAYYGENHGKAWAAKDTLLAFGISVQTREQKAKK